MNYTIIVILALLIVFIALKWNNLRTKVAFYLITLGVIFILIVGFVAFSSENPDMSKIQGISSAIKTYAVWIGQAGSGIAKISAYVFHQGWKDEGNKTIGG